MKYAFQIQLIAVYRLLRLGLGQAQPGERGELLGLRRGEVALGHGGGRAGLC